MHNESFQPRHVGTGSYVRLLRPIPELGLNEGYVGVVRGVLPGLADAYEVEFHRPSQDVPARALLLGTHVEAQGRPLLTEARVEAHRW